jgi:hypothetical protein
MRSAGPERSAAALAIAVVMAVISGSIGLLVSNRNARIADRTQSGPP